MKYKVTHKCGHVEEVELFGPDAQRKRIIEDREKHCLCSTCADQKNSAQAESMGWPELAGSPKQISWAKDIRSGIHRNFEAEVEKDRAGARYAANADIIEARIAMARNYIFGQTSAKYWIDRRNSAISALVTEAAKASKE